MSRLILNKTIAPNPPASEKIAIFYDSDDKELKYINEYGEEIPLTPLGLTDQNILINGGFDFSQLQVPGTLTTYSNTSGRTMVADNWKITNENASVQYQRIDSSGNPEIDLRSRFYGKFKKITSAGKLCISQVVGNTDMCGARGETVRFQIKLRASTALTAKIALLYLTNSGTIDTIPATFISAFGSNGIDPTFGTNLSELTPITALESGAISGNSISCPLTTNWELFSGTFEVPLNCKNLIVVVFSNNQMAANDEINLAEAYLSQEASVKDWAPLPLTLEQVRVQGIFCKTFSLDTAPAQNAGLTGSLSWMSGKAAALAMVGGLSWRFPTTMRTTPTLTAYNPSAANAQVRDASNSVDCSATSFANTNDSGTMITTTGNALTVVGSQLALHIAADASI